MAELCEDSRSYLIGAEERIMKETNSSNLQHEVCDEDNIDLIEQEKRQFDALSAWAKKPRYKMPKYETIVENISDAIVGNLEEMKSFIGLILILAFAVLFYGLMFAPGLLGVYYH